MTLFATIGHYSPLGFTGLAIVQDRNLRSLIVQTPELVQSPTRY